jgi:hypothetical protein
MDMFEQWLENSWMRNAHEKKAIMEEKRLVCTCPACPSYNRCAGESKELVYCISGKSPLCITKDLGCSCRKCPVTPMLGLKYHDFCFKGSEAAQRYEHEVH